MENKISGEYANSTFKFWVDRVRLLSSWKKSGYSGLRVGDRKRCGLFSVRRQVAQDQKVNTDCRGNLKTRITRKWRLHDVTHCSNQGQTVRYVRVRWYLKWVICNLLHICSQRPCVSQVLNNVMYLQYRRQYRSRSWIPLFSVIKLEFLYPSCTYVLSCIEQLQYLVRFCINLVSISCVWIPSRISILQVVSLKSRATLT
jgi:hypothetical protein